MRAQTKNNPNLYADFKQYRNRSDRYNTSDSDSNDSESGNILDDFNDPTVRTNGTHTQINQHDRGVMDVLKSLKSFTLGPTELDDSSSSEDDSGLENDDSEYRPTSDILKNVARRLDRQKQTKNLMNQPQDHAIPKIINFTDTLMLHRKLRKPDTKRPCTEAPQASKSGPKTHHNPSPEHVWPTDSNKSEDLKVGFNQTPNRSDQFETPEGTTSFKIKGFTNIPKPLGALKVLGTKRPCTEAPQASRSRRKTHHNPSPEYVWPTDSNKSEDLKVGFNQTPNRSDQFETPEGTTSLKIKGFTNIPRSLGALRVPGTKRPCTEAPQASRSRRKTHHNPSKDNPTTRTVKP